MRKHVLALGLAALGFVVLSSGAMAQEEAMPPLEKQKWSFDGPFGTYDRAALQRGFEVFQNVCSNCHSLKLVTYGDYGPGGPGGGLGYNDDEVKAIAAAKETTDGPNDQGEMFQRPARASDHIVPPFPNDQANRAAHNGALPPDLSLIVKAREGNADYVYGILTGYKPTPAGMKMPDTMQYNEHFPGHQISMPAPLSDDLVTYADGTKATTAQEAHDVVTFLQWAAEPHLEDRKRTGVKVMIFLLFMTGVLYAAKRKIWASVH